jgi:hypothetical protein
LKESVEVHVLPETKYQGHCERAAAKIILPAQPYVKDIKYTIKETAKKEWIKTGGEDFT